MKFQRCLAATLLLLACTQPEVLTDTDTDDVEECPWNWMGGEALGPQGGYCRLTYIDGFGDGFACDGHVSEGDVILCPGDLFEGEPCGDVTGVGCCDAEDNVWYCGLDPCTNDPILIMMDC